MSTLTEFLLARIAEEEGLARRVFDAGWPRYLAVTPESEGVEASVSIGTDGPKDNFRVWQREHATEFGWAIHESGGVVWDPARVLRDCETRRRIVERLQGIVSRGFVTELHAGVLLDLASVYADHQDYRAEWRR